MKKFIGCDLGGTNLRAAIVDVETGDVLHHMSIPTLAREGHDVVMQRMAGLFLQVIESAGMQKDDIGGIGIGVPGVLDLEKGETLFLPNLSGTWPHVPLTGYDHASYRTSNCSAQRRPLNHERRMALWSRPRRGHCCGLRHRYGHRRRTGPQRPTPSRHRWYWRRTGTYDDRF